MPSTWGEILQKASFDGTEFHCRSVDDDISSAWIMHEYPDRPGADLEFKGRRPLRFSTEAIVFGDHYPEVMNFLAKAAQDKKTADLVHPIWGKVNCALVGCRIHHDGGGIDSAVLSLDFLEDTGWSSSKAARPHRYLRHIPKS
jgi:prophage DNA circulation protein